MVVYILWQGSDNILGVFSTKGKAKRYAQEKAYEPIKWGQWGGIDASITTSNTFGITSYEVDWPIKNSGTEPSKPE